MKHQILSSSAKSVVLHRTSTTLILAIAATLFAIQAIAQSTSGHIFGHGPAGAKVEAHSSAGARRAVTIKDNGRYDIRSLPTGTYTVTLLKDDTPVDTRRNIGLIAGRGAEIDFACANDQCAAAGPNAP